MNELAIIETTAIDQPARYAADKNPALVYLAGLSESSRRTQAQSLNAIADIIGVERIDDSSGRDVRYMAVPWGSLRFEHTQAIRGQLGERYAHATANRHLSALRGVLKDAWRLGYMTAEEQARACDLKPIRGATASQAEKGRHLAACEIAGLMNACDYSNAGARDAAIIAIGYGCGLRRAELAGLELEDYDDGAGSLRIQHGKGNKERVVFLPPGAVAALNAWIAVRGDEPGPLFYSIRRGDNIQAGQGITAQAVYVILSSRAEAAGVEKFSPHDLRRTFAGDALDVGVDLSTVQKMMGHSNSATTAGYDRRDSKAKARAASMIHVPYRGQLL